MEVCLLQKIFPLKYHMNTVAIVSDKSNLISTNDFCGSSTESVLERISTAFVRNCYIFPFFIWEMLLKSKPEPRTVDV